MAKKKFLAWSPIRDLMKNVGAGVVAHDAVDALVAYLETIGAEVATNALKVTRHGKRTKITREDVDYVIGIGKKSA